MQHILFVEDDPLMQRFVTYALEEAPFTLTCCETVPQAMAKLAQQSFDWILTDLMLPGISGLSFIQTITQTPALTGHAKIVALSAGIDETVKQQLLVFGVTRQLLKPVSVSTLHAVLDEGAELHPPAGPAITEAPAVERYFGADQELFDKFTIQSRVQFRQDVRDGDHWVAAGNITALHNLAHSLKSVLLLLGKTQALSMASALERAAVAHPSAADLNAAWADLRHHLSGLSNDTPD